MCAKTVQSRMVCKLCANIISRRIPCKSCANSGTEIRAGHRFCRLAGLRANAAWISQGSKRAGGGGPARADGRSAPPALAGDGDAAAAPAAQAARGSAGHSAWHRDFAVLILRPEWRRPAGYSGDTGGSGRKPSGCACVSSGSNFECGLAHWSTFVILQSIRF